jgi:hypothetical protein
MIAKFVLIKQYSFEKKSASEIATILGCSISKVNYWLKKNGITKRSISEAVYSKKNPNGNPFSVTTPLNKKEILLLGLGLGLYWGEGNKKNKSEIRLGNSDPDLLNCFIHFLEKRYVINRRDLRFSLQVHNDVVVSQVEAFWRNKLNVSKTQFYKTIVSKSNKKGTYRNKSQNGVLTVYFLNSRLRNHLLGEIEKLRDMA